MIWKCNSPASAANACGVVKWSGERERIRRSASAASVNGEIDIKSIISCEKPSSRKAVVAAWNVSKASLAPRSKTPDELDLANQFEN